MDETISFWGGSEVIAPSGATVFPAPLFDEGLYFVDVDLGDVRRERIALPLLRDERPEVVLRQLERIVRERAGAAAEPEREDGSASGTERRPSRAVRRCRRSWPSTRTWPAACIVDFIRDQLRQAGFGRALLGLSGGIDSALVAYLAAEAIGPEPAVRADALPDLVARVAARRRARSCDRLGCASDLVDISPMVDGYFGPTDGLGAGGPDGSTAPAATAGNFMARARMCVLYDRSVTWGGLVVGTGNKTESLIGYTTLFGDTACAFNPIGDLYKSQVRQLAAAVGVPDAIMRKAPSADLWPGQTDEAEVGFSYAELDRLLFWMIDKRRTDDELVAMGFDAAMVERVEASGRGLRVQAPGAAGRQARTADDGRRLPLSAAPAAVPAPAAAEAAARVSAARPAAARRRRLYVVATPIGNLGDVTLPRDRGAARRAARRRRGHAADPPALGALRDRHAAGELPRPERPGASAELLAHLRGGADLALVTDAGTPLVSDPGAALVAAWAAGGRARRADPRRVGRAGRARRERPAGRALELRGLPATQRPGAAGAPGAHRGRRPRERPVRGARPGARRRCATWPSACGEDRPAALARELTKLHESIWRGGLGALAARAAAEPPRGEVTIVVAGRPEPIAPAVPGPGDLDLGREEVAGLVAGGLSRSEAARRVAARTGLPRRELFREG